MPVGTIGAFMQGEGGSTQGWGHIFGVRVVDTIGTFMQAKGSYLGGSGQTLGN